MSEKNMIKILRNVISMLKKTFIYITHIFKSLVTILKRTFVNLYYRFAYLSENILLKLYTSKISSIIFFYIIIFILGRFLALKEDFPWSLVHQVNLSIISVIGIYMLQYLHNVIMEIRNNMLGINEYISIPLNKLNKARLSPINILLPIYPVLSFCYKIVKMEYVPISVIGFFAIFMAASAFYIALMCYWQLLMATITIYRLTQIEYINLPFSFPNDIFDAPEWISKLAEIYKKTQFSFFTVGILFTIEYNLLIPDDVPIFDATGKLNTSLPYDFWSTWIIIFVFVIIAFPLFWFILKKLLINLTQNLNKKAVSEMTLLNSHNLETDLSMIWSYYQLANNAIKFDKQLFPKYNFYPLIATGLSFFLNMVKLFELFKLPFLGSSI